MYQLLGQGSWCLAPQDIGTCWGTTLCTYILSMYQLLGQGSWCLAPQDIGTCWSTPPLYLYTQYVQVLGQGSWCLAPQDIGTAVALFLYLYTQYVPTFGTGFLESSTTGYWYCSSTLPVLKMYRLLGQGSWCLAPQDIDTCCSTLPVPIYSVCTDFWDWVPGV